jgi:DNA-binding PadR family transcriptional regulator
MQRQMLAAIDAMTRDSSVNVYAAAIWKRMGNIAFSSTYTLLERLRARGLVIKTSPSKQQQTYKGLPRSLYTLSSKGKSVLNEQRSNRPGKARRVEQRGTRGRALAPAVADNGAREAARAGRKKA